MLFVVTKKKILLEAIDHIKNVSEEKLTTKRLLFYINKSLATNCGEATVEDALRILSTKI